MWKMVGFIASLVVSFLAGVLLAQGVGIQWFVELSGKPIMDQVVDVFLFHGRILMTLLIIWCVVCTYCLLGVLVVAIIQEVYYQLVHRKVFTLFTKRGKSNQQEVQVTPRVYGTIHRGPGNGEVNQASMEDFIANRGKKRKRSDL